MKASSALLYARRLLGSEENWTKGTSNKATQLSKKIGSREYHYVYRPVDLLEAVRMDCADIETMTYDRTAEREATVALEAVVNMNLMSFNDRKSTTHADILDALERAIKRCKKQGL